MWTKQAVDQCGPFLSGRGVTSVSSAALGFLAYVAAVMVPGYGFGELLGRWKDDDGLVRRVGYSLGYGLAVDTIVLAVKTSGLRLGGVELAGIDQATVYFIILLGVAFLAASFVFRRKVSKLPRLTKYDGWALCCVLLVGLFLLWYQMVYPYFPPFYNPDFLAIVGQAEKLISGTELVFPKMLLYGSGYYQTAAAFLSVGSHSLSTAQTGIDILAALSPALVYAVAADMFGSRRAALLSAAIYSLSGTLWLQMLTDGFYPNFVGLLLELVLLAAFVDLSRAPRSRLSWMSSGAIVIASYFSHFTVLALFGSFIIYSVALALMRSPSFRTTAATAGAFIAPAAVGGLLFPDRIRSVLEISYQSGSPQPFTTFLSQGLSFLPPIAYLAFNMRNDIGFIALMALLTIAVVKGAKGRDQSVILLSVWFFALLAAAPQNYATWRFTLEAVMPLTLLAGYGLSATIPEGKATKRARLRAGDPYKFAAVVFTLLFLTPVAALGWTSTFAQSMAANGGVESQVQNLVNDSMTWIAANTPSSAHLLSVTDPVYLFSTLQIGRNCTYYFFGNQTQAIQYAKLNNESYIIVTRHDVYLNPLTPISDASSPVLPWFTYTSSQTTKLVYNNSDVRIFQLTG